MFKTDVFPDSLESHDCSMKWVRGCFKSIDLGIAVMLLSDRSERYLGRKLCFEGSQLTELKNRIAAGWAAFHKHTAELCSKFYRLRDRVKLFDAVVSPAVLYGSSAWALTQSMEISLKTVRRRMLRYVFLKFAKEQINYGFYCFQSCLARSKDGQNHGMRFGEGA